MIDANEEGLKYDRWAESEYGESMGEFQGEKARKIDCAAWNLVAAERKKILNGQHWLHVAFGPGPRRWDERAETRPDQGCPAVLNVSPPNSSKH